MIGEAATDFTSSILLPAAPILCQTASAWCGHDRLPAAAAGRMSGSIVLCCAELPPCCPGPARIADQQHTACRTFRSGKAHGTSSTLFDPPCRAHSACSQPTEPVPHGREFAGGAGRPGRRRAPRSAAALQGGPQSGQAQRRGFHVSASAAGAVPQRWARRCHKKPCRPCAGATPHLPLPPPLPAAVPPTALALLPPFPAA